MALAPDDHMIVDGHPQQPPGLGDALGDLDVGAARLGRAGGMVVNQDQRVSYELAEDRRGKMSATNLRQA